MLPKEMVGLMKQQTFLLRDCAEADEPVVLEIIKAAFEEQRGRVHPPSSAHHKTLAILQAERQTARAIVAEIASAPPQLVGCIFYETKAESIYFSRLAVLPTHRGQGIGAALIGEVERRAAALGARSVTLSVRVALTEQHTYYAKRGYQFVCYTMHPGFTEPTSMVMEKAL
ncbi:MAG: GNAT family N-acetyltransferase [Caldilineaceae bacterium]|nr:GNAT family N-acetyltransferase [Caldilineaceae bacterium]